jgi:hypothetical protein
MLQFQHVRDKSRAARLTDSIHNTHKSTHIIKFHLRILAVQTNVTQSAVARSTPSESPADNITPWRKTFKAICGLRYVLQIRENLDLL